MSVGKQVKLAREQAGMSQRKLAGERYTGSYICQIESGKTRPSLKALEYIAIKLNKPISFFYTEEDAVPSEQRNKLIDVLINFGYKSIMTGNYFEAQKVLEEAFEHNKEVNSIRRQANILLALGISCRELSEYDKSRDYLAEAHKIFTDLNSKKDIAETLFRIAQLHVKEGNNRIGEKYISQAEKIIDENKIGDPILLANIWNIKGLINADSGELNKSIKAYERALKYSENATNLQKMGEIYSNMSIALKDAGELDKAVDCSSKSIGIFELLNNIEKRASTTLNLGIVYHEKGEFDKARLCLLEAYDVFKEIGRQEFKAYVSTELAKLEIAAGDFEKANSYGKEALALVEEYCDDMEKGRVLSVLGDIAVGKKDWKTAKQLYKKSINLLEKFNITVDLTKVLQKYSQLLLTTGETKEASSYLQEAINKIGKLEIQRS